MTSEPRPPIHPRDGDWPEPSYAIPDYKSLNENARRECARLRAELAALQAKLAAARVERDEALKWREVRAETAEARAEEWEHRSKAWEARSGIWEGRAKTAEARVERLRLAAEKAVEAMDHTHDVLHKFAAFVPGNDRAADDACAGMAAIRAALAGLMEAM